MEAQEKKPRRPAGYWEDESNIERELRAWIEKHGTFPTQKGLGRTEDSSLSAAMSKNGGLTAWRSRLGYSTRCREHGYWHDETNIRRELETWIDSNGGKFPSHPELQASGDTTLASALSQTGGCDAWRRRLGFESAGKPRGYWNDGSNVERELRTVVAAHARLPTHSELMRLGLGDLASAISKRGGFPEWRRRLQLEQRRKPQGYWSDEVNIERELRAWIEKHGSFPTQHDLVKAGLSPLGQSLVKSGGYSAWRIRLGHEVTTKPAGYWMDLANVERELRAWIEKHGKFPSARALEKSGDIALSKGIRIQGFPFWQRRMGYVAGKKTNGYWMDLANVERELRAWIEKHGKFPRSSDLEKTGYASLSSALSSSDGLSVWRIRLGYGPITPECLREHADVLARVVMALNVVDTGAFWTALQSRWTMADLTAAIRAYEQEGKLERFRSLLAAAD